MRGDALNQDTFNATLDRTFPTDLGWCDIHNGSAEIGQLVTISVDLKACHDCIAAEITTR